MMKRLKRLSGGAIAATLMLVSFSASAQQDPFGSVLQGIFGGQQQRPQQAPPQYQQQRQAPVVYDGSSEDAAAYLLRQIDLGKQIAAKAEELKLSVLDVVYTIKVYQSANAALWLDLGQQAQAINSLEDRANANNGWIRQFIASTKEKRNVYRSALRKVTLNPSADIKEIANTLSTNNRTISQLRQSVSILVDGATGSTPGNSAFAQLVTKQNVPLDELLGAYMQRMELAIATMNGASITFRNMQRDYDNAVRQMQVAIKAFEDQGQLVAAESVKQVAVLGLGIARMTQVMKQRNDVFAIVQGVARGAQLVNDAQSLISTLNTFSETRDWFDKNAQAIVIASRDARTELAESVQAMQQVRAKLVQSWGNNIKSISAAAQRERQLQTKFAAEFEQTVKRGANRAAEASATDRQELEQRLGRKPSLRTKTS
jgi:hypothetical protein